MRVLVSFYRLLLAVADGTCGVLVGKKNKLRVLNFAFLQIGLHSF
jgi:hypothetical protein